MITADFTTVAHADGSLTVTNTPPGAMGNQTIRYREFVYFGGGNPVIPISGQSFSGYLPTNLIEKWMGSGTGGGASGITMLDSGTGRFRISLPAAEISGRDIGAYAYEVERVDSGYVTMLARGYRRVI